MIQNNITFNSVKSSPKKFNVYPLTMNGQQGPDEDGMGIVNAVDIDWNGAVIDQNTTIDTTGELISWIKNLENSAIGNLTFTQSGNVLNLNGSLIYEPELTVGPQGPQGPQGILGELGIQGIQGPQGEKGADGTMTFEDLTPEQKASLKGDKGDKGDTGEGFSIYKTYSSISAMNADASNVAEGKFVLISSNVEDENNAKLFVKTSNKFNFLTDLSGAQGIQGPKGDTGAAGSNGAKGDKGDTGAQGPQGLQGIQGELGIQGEQGKSAYEVAVDAGYTGTLAQWLQSLKGTNGTNGTNGTSITISSIQYVASSNGTSTPSSGWSTSIPTVSQGLYLWTKVTYSDNSVAYTKAYQGVDGQGEEGSNGGIVFGYYGVKIDENENEIYGIYDIGGRNKYDEVPSNAILLSTLEGIVYVDKRESMSYYIKDGRLTQLDNQVIENAWDGSSGLMSQSDYIMLHPGINNESSSYDNTLYMDGKVHYMNASSNTISTFTLRTDYYSNNLDYAIRFPTEFYIKVNTVPTSITVAVENGGSDQLSSFLRVILRKIDFNTLSDSYPKYVKLTLRNMGYDTSIGKYNILIEWTAFNATSVI